MTTRHGTLREQLTFHNWDQAEARSLALSLLDRADRAEADADRLARVLNAGPKSEDHLAQREAALILHDEAVAQR